MYSTGRQAAALVIENPSFLTCRKVLAGVSIGQGDTCENRDTLLPCIYKKLSPCKKLDITGQGWSCDM